MSDRVNPLTTMATTTMAQTSSYPQKKSASWYEAMAEAWGKTLNAKANEIEVASDQLSNGDDTPAHITQMTVLAQEMAFMSNSAHTSIQSVGTALETVARKQ